MWRTGSEAVATPAVETTPAAAGQLVLEAGDHEITHNAARKIHGVCCLRDSTLKPHLVVEWGK
jgi:hypothetical protein